MKGTCKYVGYDVLRLKCNDIMIEVFPKDTCKFSYYFGGMYTIRMDPCTIYMKEHDFHKYFSVRTLERDEYDN